MATPQTPPPSEAYAATLIALYVLAEQQLLVGATSILRRMTPDLAGRQAAVPRLRRLVRMILGPLASQSNQLVVRLLDAAVREGRADATAAVGTNVLRRSDVAGGGGVTHPPSRDLVGDDDEPFDLSLPHGERAARAIRRDLISELEDVRFRITRLPNDIYKAIAPEAAIYQVRDNDFTSAHAQAAAWRVFVSQGVTGFTDRSGRNWSLSAYVEMAVRTASARAFNASHLERMHALGIDYFSVPDTGHPCPLCFPWQHKVLTDGPIADPVIRVDATIAEATAAGLFHPNCRHVLTPVIPGVTRLPAPVEWNAEHQAIYDASQRQRRLELAERKAKSRLDFALDAATRKEALADIRDAQSKLRVLVNATGLPRQSRREQVNLTDQRIKMPIPIR